MHVPHYFIASALVFVFLCGCVEKPESPAVHVAPTTTVTTLLCVDSDSGRNYSGMGFISGFGEDGSSIDESDYCLNSDQLIEFLCDSRGYVISETVSCKGIGLECGSGCCHVASDQTTTTTTTSTTSTTTSSTMLGECVTGSCGEARIVFSCANDTDVDGFYVYVQRKSVIPYCANAYTWDAKCKSKESYSVEDRCMKYEVCVEGLKECQSK